MLASYVVSALKHIYLGVAAGLVTAAGIVEDGPNIHVTAHGWIMIASSFVTGMGISGVAKRLG